MSVTTARPDIDATLWPTQSDSCGSGRLLTWRCVIGMSVFQGVLALLFSDAARQGVTELARVVTAGSVPALAIWTLRTPESAAQCT